MNLKRFERRPNEVLVLAELLDRTVTIRENGQSASVVDVGMEPTRARDWVISRLAVRTAGSRLARRRGQLFQVEWDEVDGLGVATTAQGADAVLATLADLRAADVANALQDMPDKRRVEIATALDDERLADVLQEMEEDDQVALLRSLADERAADVLEAMDDDDAADLLGEMPTADQERLLRADGARGRRAGPPPDELRRLHGRRPDDVRAGDHAAGRDGGRGPGAGPRPRAVPGDRRAGVRGAPAAGHARPAVSSARPTCSGCCASRRPRWSAAPATGRPARCVRTRPSTT